MDAQIEPVDSVNRVSAKVEIKKFIDGCPIYRSDDYLDFFHLVLSMNPVIAKKGILLLISVKDLVSFSRDQVLQDKKIQKRRQDATVKMTTNTSLVPESLDQSTFNFSSEATVGAFFQPDSIWAPGYFEAVQHLNEKYGIVKDAIDYQGNKQIVYDQLIHEDFLIPHIQPFQSRLALNRYFG